MGDKRSPTRPKRHYKPSADDCFGHWDCSVCTFRNSAEAFKCLMCDVRKGTSTRKPRPVSTLVAQQANQHFAPPTHHKRKEKSENNRSEKEVSLKRNNSKKTRPRLKNIDRSSAQHLEVTVGDLTVIITDFKEKVKPPASAVSIDQLSHSGFSSDSTERDASRCSSPHRDSSSVNGDTH